LGRELNMDEQDLQDKNHNRNLIL